MNKLLIIGLLCSTCLLCGCKKDRCGTNKPKPPKDDVEDVNKVPDVGNTFLMLGSALTLSFGACYIANRKFVSG